MRRQGQSEQFPANLPRGWMLLSHQRDTIHVPIDFCVELQQLKKKVTLNFPLDQ